MAIGFKFREESGKRWKCGERIGRFIKNLINQIYKLCMPHIWGNTNTQTELNDKTFTICFPNLDQSTKGKKVNML